MRRRTISSSTGSCSVMAASIGSCPIYPVSTSIIKSFSTLCIGFQNCPLPLAALRVLDKPAERVHELHFLDRLAAGLQEPWRAHEDREALRPRDRHIETIAREEERQVTRHVLPARGRHREEHHRRLLPLELVHGADTHATRETRP